ncbi:hypothetical protein [Dinoroseobacter sp. S124A]|uniref:hypothetical protein n=1 Tax=Dinoroseobacter sp. S124A TaxID=3415128 RepID=UPI003C799F65
MTLARELEDLEARRAAGTLSDADVEMAKDALLRAAAETRLATPARGERSLLIAGLASNLLLTLVILALIAAGAYLLAPLTVAVPVMILCALALPVLWLWEWVTDLF